MNVTLIGADTIRNMPVDGSNLSTSAVSVGDWIYKETVFTTFQLISEDAAVCSIEATNDVNTAQGNANNTVLLGTITLAAAGSDGFTTDALWRWVRANVTAAVAPTSVLMGS